MGRPITYNYKPITIKMWVKAADIIYGLIQFNFVDNVIRYSHIF